jgi:hypothetical protein
MSRTHRSNVRRSTRPSSFLELEFHPELVPVDEHLAGHPTRIVLEAVLRSHRWQLVSVARHHLGNERRLAEDVVQDLCLEVLEGHLVLSSDPTEALDELLREIIERCDG